MVIKQGLTLLLCSSIALSACAPAFANPANQSQPVGSQQVSATSNTQQSPAQVQQLVAPIALYPNSLVAQVLAASTYPAEVVEAQRWVTQHKGLSAQQRADEVNKLSWDPSIKSLIAFPSVLANMDKNLSWTSSLGQAYVQNPQEVMNTIQQLRHRAQSAGHLSSTSQESVSTHGQDIVIQPMNPEVVYSSGIRSLAGLWAAVGGMAWLVWLSRTLFWRARDFLWGRYRYRRLRSLWLGMAPLGL